jgi:signal transduction histidine kinase/DNA-binding response OmpR family regulator
MVQRTKIGNTIAPARDKNGKLASRVDVARGVLRPASARTVSVRAQPPAAPPIDVEPLDRRQLLTALTALRRGEFSVRLPIDYQGIDGKIADAFNDVVELNDRLAKELERLSRVVGKEGKIAQRASIGEVRGTWADTVASVNALVGDLVHPTSEQDWLKTNLAKFSRMLLGQKDLLTVGRLILSELAPVVGTKQGVFYIMEPTKEEPVLKLLASYAYKERKNVDNTFKLGEGLVGQCALERKQILLVNVPKDYTSITSGLGEAPPLNIIVMPVLFEGHVKAVLELASFDRFSPTHQAFLDQLTESIGIVLNTIEANMRTENLLKQSQSLAGELQSQQEELQQTNAELGEKARLLAEQNAEVERKNREVEQARQALEEKARQLALTSKYKSEFLADMSHELRTPLNSLLILSDQLSKNTDSNLTGRQVEFAKTIHSSGNDLLALINDILDLSKIESGTVILDVGDLSFRDLSEYVERTFRHVADAKKLRFDLELDPTLPRSLHTDAKRLQQVLKNLLSNAFKFTDRGSVALSVAPATQGWSLDNEHLDRASSVLAFTVRDTGIGIQPDKQMIIFEAFRQADGSTSRKYGGTGLGLAISREISRMLGGEIKLVSVPMGGSTFTLYLPDSYAPPRSILRREPALTAEAAMVAALPPAPEPEELVNQGTGDTDPLGPDDQVLLIVDANLDRARSLAEIASRHGLKAMSVARGGAAGAMARELGAVAITLDINLPDIDGWQVLDRLKHDLTTRHIPVEVLAPARELAHALGMGAHGLIPVPLQSRQPLEEAVSRLRRSAFASTRRLVIVDPDPAEIAAITTLLAGDDLVIVGASTATDALAALDRDTPDLVVIGGDLPDLSAVDLLAHLDREGALAGAPVLLRGEVAAGDEARLARSGHRRTIERVATPDALVDEATIFLHLQLSKRSAAARSMLESLLIRGTALAGKKVLVVDDDIRNIFAITTILDEHDMNTVSAETGSAAIEVLDRTPDIDIVLMDIMMPDMDGYDTMRAIRRRESFRALPIIAVTAKAMKGDRAKCFEAGATDYVAKPINPDQLLALMRVWLRP